MRATLVILTAVFIVLWLLGVMTAHTMGGLIQILFAVAIMMALVRVIRGRRVV
jgi:Family of unknown function (DUF5670)